MSSPGREETKFMLLVLTFRNDSVVKRSKATREKLHERGEKLTSSRSIWQRQRFFRGALGNKNESGASKKPAGGGEKERESLTNGTGKS